jgi:GAF domain-containing protein
MSDDDRLLAATLRASATRLAAADRLSPARADDALSAIAGAAVVALDAQAASIAVHDSASDRLVFRAAAGPAAGDIVGMAIDAGAGIAGYAFTTGQPLAVADVTADPRFDRSIAEATGYMPGSLLAVPLLDETGTLGVLEALDRRGGTFTLHDLDVATAIAAVATAAVMSGRRRHDAATLLTAALSDVLVAAGDVEADLATIEAAVTRATEGLDEDDQPTLLLADRIARLRDTDPEAMRLAIEWLDALIRFGEGQGPSRGPGGVS